MRKLGLQPTPGSGCGWIKKEDGESDTYLAQLKSTDGKSISLKIDDIRTLFDNALIAHKTPVFFLSFKKEKVDLVAFKVEDVAKLFKQSEKQ